MLTPWTEVENDTVIESKFKTESGHPTTDETLLKIRAVKNSENNYDAVVRSPKGILLVESRCNTTRENACTIAMGLALNYLVDNWKVNI